MNLFKSFKNLITLLNSKKKYLFFFENSSSEIHFSLLLDNLSEEDYEIVCLKSNHVTKYRKFFNLENLYLLIILFTLIRNKIILMTTPDLDNLYLKKYSSNTYIYIHHSICSSHMIYNEKAFDNFDIIFNVGEFQNKEIRYREKSKKLKKKLLINYGYGKLDLIMSCNEICIAPSWNLNNKFLDYVEKILDNSINNFKVRFRPHKNSFRYHKKKISNLIEKYSKFENFILDLDPNSLDYVLKSKYFFSDWSGASFEYAFSRLRPVIFFQSPLKINNPKHNEVPFQPVEIVYRERIGLILKESDLNNLNKIYLEIDKNLSQYENKIFKARSELLYNIGTSGKFGKKFLDELN